MQKIYGYREKDVLGLIDFINNNKTKTLSAVFSEYANFSGKSKGTVRNLYYALAKKSNEDREFCQKYLGGRALKVTKSLAFDKDEELDLVKEILTLKADGNSVRKSIQILANGDPSLALRYQNKFRNVIKTQKSTVLEVAKDLSREKGIRVDCSFLEKEESCYSCDLDGVKKSVFAVIEKATKSLQEENQNLKTRVDFLEKENLKLIDILLKKGKKNDEYKRTGSLSVELIN